MRHLYVTVAVCVSAEILSASIPVNEIERMVKTIHLKRPGISLEKLDNTKDPFVVFTRKEDENVTVVEKPKPVFREEQVRLELHALMGKRAFIDNGWRKEGDVVKGYKIVYIGKRGVVLRKENTIRTLFIDKFDKKNSLIKLEKRD